MFEFLNTLSGIAWIFSIVVCAELGKKKGFKRSWAYGLFLGPVGVFYIFVRPEKTNTTKKAAK